MGADGLAELKIQGPDQEEEPLKEEESPKEEPKEEIKEEEKE